jgi:hypothetical protein
MKNLGAYLFGTLLLIGLLEILAFVTLAGVEINDFKNEVKLHNSHFYTPHTLVNATDKPFVIINPKSMVDTLVVDSKLTFAVSISHHYCPICAGRDANPWLIRTIWPLFDIKN